MKELTLALLTKRLEQLENDGLTNTDKEQSYLHTYPAMLRHVSKTTFDQESLLTTALMVYGWMPTIPVLNTKQIDNLPDRLNQLRAVGKELETSELEQLQKFLNNSVVGASKLLHFIRPDIYPIWDSRVSVNCGGRKWNGYINKVDTYLEYKKRLTSITGEKAFEALNQRLVVLPDLTNTNVREWTKLRVGEFLLFV